MKQFIIYNTPEGEVAVIHPCLECGLTVQQIAEKDVPSGRRYKIVAQSDIPNAPQSAWVVDDADLTDGVGA